MLLLEETLRFADENQYPQQVAELRGILARAHMLAGDLTRAVETADASLVAAERQGLTLVIAEAMITKGTALGDLGRLREGVALLQGALELAIEHELPTAELRARTNLSHLTWDDDPAAQLANLRAGFEKARRLGNRGWAVVLIGNLFDVLRATGDFDGALAALDSLDLEGLPFQQQVTLQLVRMTVLRYREDPAVVRPEVERLAADRRPASPTCRATTTPSPSGRSPPGWTGITRPPSPSASRPATPTRWGAASGCTRPARLPCGCGTGNA